MASHAHHVLPAEDEAESTRAASYRIKHDRMGESIPIREWSKRDHASGGMPLQGVNDNAESYTSSIFTWTLTAEPAAQRTSENRPMNRKFE